MSDDIESQFERALMALRLELPQVVAEHFTAIARAYIAELRSEAERQEALIAELRAEVPHMERFSEPTCLACDEAWPCDGFAASLLDPKAYDKNFGDERVCSCGHPYYRHFDTYEEMRPVGCKYCDGDCMSFLDPKEEAQVSDA